MRIAFNKAYLDSVALCPLPSRDGQPPKRPNQDTHGRWLDSERARGPSYVDGLRAKLERDQGGANLGLQP